MLLSRSFHTLGVISALAYSLTSIAMVLFNKAVLSYWEFDATMSLLLLQVCLAASSSFFRTNVWF
jgi:hypothetical protein